MSIAFWSIVLKSGDKPKEIQPPEGYVLNLQLAALTKAGKNSVKTIKITTESIEGEEMEAVIGTLRAVTSDQIQLGIALGYDVPAKFSISGDGDGEVHLSGNSAVPQVIIMLLL